MWILIPYLLQGKNPFVVAGYRGGDISYRLDGGAYVDFGRFREPFSSSLLFLFWSRNIKLMHFDLIDTVGRLNVTLAIQFV